MNAINKKNLKIKTNSTESTKYVLVTDVRYEYLIKIFNKKCLGEVSFYTDEDNNNRIEGEFRASSRKYKNYAWEWAHKIYYSYERLTSDVGNYLSEDCFENECSEYMYIFENLTFEDIEIIEKVIREHHLLFKCELSDDSFVNIMATATHNYYCAYQKVGMKYHIYCNDYSLYLNSAKEHLEFLKEFIKENMFEYSLSDAIDDAVNNIEDFMLNTTIRDYLLEQHQSKFSCVRHIDYEIKSEQFNTCS